MGKNTVPMEEADDVVRFLLDEMMAALAAVDVEPIRYYMRLSRAWDTVRERLLIGEIVSERPDMPDKYMVAAWKVADAEWRTYLRICLLSALTKQCGVFLLGISDANKGRKTLIRHQQEITLCPTTSKKSPAISKPPLADLRFDQHSAFFKLEVTPAVIVALGILVSGILLLSYR